jgi:cytochrome c oxidase assembly protein subunit 15
VILWGAYVRASGSGAGCGSHWPSCNGEVIPRSPGIQTIIEFTHRVSSGVALVAVIGLAGWSFFGFARGHKVRTAAMFSVGLLLVEAGLGAGLVLFQYVAGDASVGRVYYLSLHLVNTLLLLAALALTAWLSRDEPQPRGKLSRLVVASLPIAILVSMTGVVAALGDTLFPAASSLAEGVRQDFSSGSHFLLRLRIAHPILAVCSAGYFVTAAISVLKSRPGPLVQRIAFTVMVVAIAQLCAGAINLVLHAPVWMQISHLLLADAIWVSFVLLTFEARVPAQP